MGKNQNEAIKTDLISDIQNEGRENEMFLRQLNCPTYICATLMGSILNQKTLSKPFQKYFLVHKSLFLDTVLFLLSTHTLSQQDLSSHILICFLISE